MTSKEGIKGRIWERLCEESGRSAGVPVTRIRLRGSDDEGDLWHERVLIECKNHKTPCYGAWLDEASRKAAETGKDFAVVLAKRRGKPRAEEGLAVMSIADLWKLVSAAYGQSSATGNAAFAARTASL